MTQSSHSLTLAAFICGSMPLIQTTSNVSTITDLDAPWRPRHVTQEMILKVCLPAETRGDGSSAKFLNTCHIVQAADKLSIRPTPAQSPAAFLATLSHVHLNNCKLTAVAEEEGSGE